MRKLDVCLCENKGTDQLRGNQEADQRRCFHYSDSTVPKDSSTFLWLQQTHLCRTWSETLKTCFLTSRLISKPIKSYDSVLQLHVYSHVFSLFEWMLYVHCQQLSSCRDCQLSSSHFWPRQASQREVTTS